MKYIITGSLGHISKPLVTGLIKAGHEVSVITQSNERASAIEALGAKAFVGSVEDSAFIEQAFAGQDAAYLMIPPTWQPTDWLAWQKQVADHYVNALVKGGVKKVVQLSSIGAHLGTGAGPIDGLAYLEKQLQAKGVDTVALRPSYFYYNLLTQIPMIKGAGIMGSNFGQTGEKMVLVHTDDIAEAALNYLLNPSFKGFKVQYISSTEIAPNEIASTLGGHIAKPELPWIQMEDEALLGGMLQGGLSEVVAKSYVQMGKAIREGKLQEDYWKSSDVYRGKVSFDDFAQVFAKAYNAN